MTIHSDTYFRAMRGRPKISDTFTSFVAAQSLILALEDAIHYHRTLEPPRPTTPDQLPARMYHHWQDHQRLLETLLGSLQELGDRVYSVERATGEG